MIINSDCIDGMRMFPDNYFDSVVTDPPYELGFMGKTWDASGIAYNVAMWREALRVLKPGGHMLAFSGSRTYHRMVCAIEDAGFEVRDQIMWIYGSGFPKSLDVSKAIDKAAGAVREVIGTIQRAPAGSVDESQSGGRNYRMGGEQAITAPVTDAAQQWQGWGTALKPAHEPICVARKPLVGTVAANVLEWGAGAVNIDACRVDADDGENRARPPRTPNQILGGGKGTNLTASAHNNIGRWPANLLHDGSEEVLAAFPTTGPSNVRHPTGKDDRGVPGFTMRRADTEPRGVSDSGGSAARFFYCAKASKRDRDEGLDAFEIQAAGGLQGRNDGSLGSITLRANIHPTVKPTDLMRYLCRLITPPGGTVLDPFAGSGSTGKAAVSEGFSFVGFELSAEYAAIAQARIDAVRACHAA